MKKTVSLILALVLICTTLFSLTSCGGSAQDTNKAVAEATAPLKAQNDALEKTISYADARIAELEEDKAALISEKNALTEENATLKATIAELEAENASLKAEIEKLKDEGGAEFKDEIAALKNCIKGIHTRGAATNNNDGTHSYTCPVCGTVVPESHNFVNDICTGCGGMQHGHGEYEYIYFGEYPQSVKAEDVTITSTQDSRGYYLGSDGSYYAKVTALPNGVYTFTNGASIANNTVYYFKVEPIRWRILSEENGEALILCDSIIEKTKFQSSYYSIGSFYYTKANGAPEGTYANNYEYSEVRAWLNSTFLENTFSEEEQAKILTTLVDNSVASTGYTSNPYACNDTNDKIFLLSAAEVMSSDYGFSSSTGSDKARYMVLSDYARALGLYMGTSSSYYGNGYWWLRSPDYDYSPYARRVDLGGDIAYYGVYSGYGVVPALRIRL